jgi:hypothetical protein
VVIFTLQLLNFLGKSSQYPLDRRLGGPQSQSLWSREKSLTSAGNQTLAVAILAELSQLTFLVEDSDL